jgi:alpha-tubulin suppressor-like RCC1 family protein
MTVAPVLSCVRVGQIGPRGGRAVRTLKRIGTMGLCLVALSAMVAAAPASATSAGVVAWGYNGYGELGNGTTTSSDVPVAVSGLSEVTAFAGGELFSLALLSNGTVMSWGSNNTGQLGNGTATDSHVPVAVSGLSEVTAVAAGSHHSLAVLKNGTVMAWGANELGQLGNGTTSSSEVPVAVSGLSEVTAIAGGGFHSLAVLKNGTAMAWGWNVYGELGNGTTTSSNVPVAVCAMGTVGPCPTGPYLEGVTAVSAGVFGSVALLENGTVVAWGITAGSSVPVAVSGLSEVTAISAGAEHQLALLKNGTVMAWGYGGYGQLGNGTYSSGGPVAVCATGTVGPCPTGPYLEGVTAISAGAYHSLALLKNGTVMNWGENDHGELGNGTTTISSVPVTVTGLTGVTGIAAGGNHSLAFGAEKASCTTNTGTVKLSPGLTGTPAVQTMKIKGTLTGCTGEPFTEANYKATLKTAGPVSCSVLKAAGETATGTAKYKWTPKAKASTGTLSMLLTETPAVAFSGEVTIGSYSPLTLSGKATESYTGGPTCGEKVGKTAARAVKKGTFSGSGVSFY